MFYLSLSAPGNGLQRGKFAERPLGINTHEEGKEAGLGADG